MTKRKRSSHQLAHTSGRRLALESLESRQLLTATFDWHMTPRVLMGADGRIAVPNNSSYADPGVFEVVFDGASSTVANSTIPASQFQWSILGLPNQFSLSPTPSNQAEFRPKLPAGGPYTVTLDIGDSSPYQENIVVKDILVVGMGDSISAGEGSPEVPLDGAFSAPEWMRVGDASVYPPEPDNNIDPVTGESLATPFNGMLPDVEQEQDRYHALAHRSSNAPTPQLAWALEQLDPHTSVTVVHVSSSGATMDVGAWGPQDGKKAIQGTRRGAYQNDDPMPP